MCFAGRKSVGANCNIIIHHIVELHGLFPAIFSLQLSSHQGGFIFFTVFIVVVVVVLHLSNRGISSPRSFSRNQPHGSPLKHTPSKWIRVRACRKPGNEK